MKTNTIIFLLCLSGIGLQAQQSVLDSLERQLSTTKDVSKQLDILEKQGNVAYQMDFKKALVYAIKGLRLSEKTKDEHRIPKFQEMAGRMHANLLQLDSATMFFDQSYKGYEKVGNKNGQATTLFKISWVQNRKGNFEDAMETDLKALRIMEALGEPLGLAQAYERVSGNLYHQERPQEALEYALKAIDICKKNNLENEIVFALRYAGDACLAQKRHVEALSYYNEAVQLTEKLKMGPSMTADILNCRGNALKRLERYPEAIRDYEKTKALGEKANYPLAVSTAIANLGQVYMLMGNYQAALPFQLQTIQLKEESGDLSDLTENYNHLSSIYENLGETASALIFKKKAYSLRDSLLSVESDAKMSTLRTEFETEQKEAIIALQEQKIDQQQKVQWLTLGIGGLLAAFLFFGYKSYQARTKSNQLLFAKNAENELLLKEIHHRVKNNLEVVSSLLALQSAQIDDVDIKEAMLAGQNRVQSIGIVHQKLYQGKNLGAIEMKDYLVNLSESILDSFGAEERVKIEFAMEELNVDIDTAVPLGLIVNELLTNSLKYAFPKGQNGTVQIRMEARSKGMLHMEISDNGVGKSDIIQGTGFGSQLVSLLTKQLNGTMHEIIEKGTVTIFDFQVKQPI